MTEVWECNACGKECRLECGDSADNEDPEIPEGCPQVPKEESRSDFTDPSWQGLGKKIESPARIQEELQKLIKMVDSRIQKAGFQPEETLRGAVSAHLDDLNLIVDELEDLIKRAALGKKIEVDQDQVERWIAEKREEESDPTKEMDKVWNSGVRRGLEIVLAHWGKT